MDINALIVAAKEIERKSKLQEHRAKTYLKLVAAHKLAENGSEEQARLRGEISSMGGSVIDFSGAIEDLRRALRKRVKKKGITITRPPCI